MKAEKQGEAIWDVRSIREIPKLCLGNVEYDNLGAGVRNL